MTIEYATITGPVLTPDGGTGIRAQVDFLPMTADNIIAFPGGGLTQGPVTVFSGADGEFEVSEEDGGAKIPISGPAAGVVWRVTVTPLDRGPYGKLPPWSRLYEITADAALDGLVITDPLTVTPEFVADLEAIRDDASDFADDAEGAALTAAEQRTAVEAVVATNDGIMTTVASDSGSGFSGVLSATFAARDLNVIDLVKNAGAKCDGATDDTAAWNAAVAFAANVRILVPAGTSRVSAPITKTGGKLVIEGQPGSVIKPTNNYTPGATKAIINHTDPVLTVIEKLTIDGNSTVINAGAAYTDWLNQIHAIQVTTQTQAVADAAVVRVRNNTIKNFPSIGIAISGPSNVVVEDNLISDGMYHGIWVARTSGATTAYAWINRNRVTGRGDQGTDPNIGGIGILVTKVDKVDLTNNVIDSISDTATKTEGCSDVLYAFNKVTDAGKDGIKVMSHTAIPGADVYAVKRARLIGNSVVRINAWRPDGSALLLVNNASQVVVADNILEGGGTRAADAIRVNNSGGASYPAVTDVIIEGNVATGTLVAGLRATATDGVSTRACERFSIVGNRFSAPIVGEGYAAGAWIVTENTVESAAYTTIAGVSLNAPGSGSVLVARNTVVNTAGVHVFAATSHALDVVRIVQNTIRQTNNICIRVDCFGASAGTMQLADVSDNVVVDPTTGGGNISACIRIGLGKTNIKVARLARNAIRNNSGSGSVSSWFEISGSGTVIDRLEVPDNLLDNIASYIGNLTLGTNVTRISKGWKNNAAPSAGTWVVGDTVEHSAPAAGGNMGWVCTTAGTPGTWKTYGAIAS